MKKVVFIIVVLCMFWIFSSAIATNDTTAPQMVDFKILENGQRLTVGDTIHVEAKFEDESGIRIVQGFTTGPEGIYAGFTYNESKDVWEWSYTITQYILNGEFGIKTIWAYDNVGNSSDIISPNDYVIIYGCTENDTTPPQMVSFKILENGQELTIGDTIHVEVKFQDESGIKIVQGFTTGPEGIYADFIYNKNKDVWEWSYTFDEYTLEGEFKIKSIWAYDNVGNSSDILSPEDYVVFHSQLNKIKAFVIRCYKIILDRDADEAGMKTWVNELNSGRRAASEIIDCFVRSQEFLGKNYNNADAVEILYKAMLGRGSDPAGKATWVGKLDAGHPFAVVINGFCGSKEFKEICDSYGITPGSVSTEQGSESDQQIRAFVTRCYKIILGRDPDGEGMNTWFNELKSRRRAAAEIIEQFVYSQEFQNKKYSNPDAVEILYKAMLGRGSDPAGKADWVGRLEGGQPLTAIINGFCGSMEFNAICDAYGITPGSVQVQQLSSQPVVEEEPAAKQTVTKTENNVTKVEIVNPSDTENAQLGTAVQAIYINEKKAKEFIGRCYRCILGREASQSELDSWIGQMLNGTKTADQIARGFLFSGEFKDKNVSNEELVKILYRVYLNREADAEGLATWTQKLDEGTSLQALLDAFSKTNEVSTVNRDMVK